MSDKDEIESLRAELMAERIMRLEAQMMAMESSIVAAQVQRNELIRQLRELGWLPPAERPAPSPLHAIK